MSMRARKRGPNPDVKILFSIHNGVQQDQCPTIFTTGMFPSWYPSPGRVAAVQDTKVKKGVMGGEVRESRNLQPINRIKLYRAAGFSYVLHGKTGMTFF